MSAKGTNQEPIYINLDDGIIQDEGVGSRVVVMDMGGWEAIKQELDSTFLTGAAVILQRMGYGYGKSLGRMMIEKSPQQQADPYPTMKAVIMRSGWGRSGLMSGDLSKGSARIALKDCFFCSASSVSGVTDCYFLAGALNGMLDEFTAIAHRVVEDKCRAKSDVFCEFLVERLEEERLHMR
jgi:predicted hydrocarbon binding protein